MIGLIEQAWSRETTNFWMPTNPAFGQCAVTALVVQDILGGELVRCMNGEVSHYYNIIMDQELDLTRKQFGTWEPRDFSAGDRTYMLSSYDTRARYLQLWANLDELMTDRMALPFMRGKTNV